MGNLFVLKLVKFPPPQSLGITDQLFKSTLLISLVFKDIFFF